MTKNTASWLGTTGDNAQSSDNLKKKTTAVTTLNFEEARG